MRDKSKASLSRPCGPGITDADVGASVHGGRLRCWTQSDGLTLVEILVALLILGVILAAAAGSLVDMTRASAVNEHRVQATAYLTSLHEELQGLPWNRAALYAEEVSDLEGVEGVDLSDPEPTYQGETIVTIPGPVDISGRLAFVPRPHEEVTIDGRDFELFQIITERSTTDGAEDPELRRFVTIVRWELLGREYVETFESQRAPTPAELREFEDPDLRLLLVSPRVIELDEDGYNKHPITVLARFRTGTTSATVTFPTVPDETTLGMDHDTALGPPLESRGAYEADVEAGDLQFEPCDGEEPCLRSVQVLGVGDFFQVPGERTVTLISEGSDIAPPSFLSALDFGATPIEVGAEGADDYALCDPLTVDVSADAHEDDVQDAIDEDRDGLAVTVYVSGDFYTNLTMSLVGDLSAADGEGRRSGTFKVELLQGESSPWLVPPGEEYRDRFYVIAETGDGERRFSTYVSSDVLTINGVEACGS